MDNSEVTTSNNHFSTRDTTLAAYLVCMGTELLNVKYDKDGATFILYQPDKHLLDEFGTGVATVNLLSFFKAYKAMLRLVHGRQNIYVE